MKDDFGLCDDCQHRIKDDEGDWVCELIQGIDELTNKKLVLKRNPYHVQQCGAKK